MSTGSSFSSLPVCAPMLCRLYNFDDDLHPDNHVAATATASAITTSSDKKLAGLDDGIELNTKLRSAYDARFQKYTFHTVTLASQQLSIGPGNFNLSVAITGGHALIQAIAVHAEVPHDVPGRFGAHRTADYHGTRPSAFSAKNALPGAIHLGVSMRRPIMRSRRTIFWQWVGRRGMQATACQRRQCDGAHWTACAQVLVSRQNRSTASRVQRFAANGFRPVRISTAVAVSALRRMSMR